MIGPRLQLFAVDADNPTVCLHGSQSTAQLTFVQNLQILWTIASRLISYLAFIITIVIVISFARKRKTVPNVCAPELRAE